MKFIMWVVDQQEKACNKVSRRRRPQWWSILIGISMSSFGYGYNLYAWWWTSILSRAAPMHWIQNQSCHACQILQTWWMAGWMTNNRRGLVFLIASSISWFSLLLPFRGCSKSVAAEESRSLFYKIIYGSRPSGPTSLPFSPFHTHR